MFISSGWFEIKVLCFETSWWGNAFSTALWSFSGFPSFWINLIREVRWRGREKGGQQLFYQNGKSGGGGFTGGLPQSSRGSSSSSEHPAHWGREAESLQLHRSDTRWYCLVSLDLNARVGICEDWGQKYCFQIVCKSNTKLAWISSYVWLFWCSLQMIFNLAYTYSSVVPVDTCNMPSPS